MYYPCSKNKDVDQLCGYRVADLRLCFRICKNPVFSRRGSNVARTIQHAARLVQYDQTCYFCFIFFKSLKLHRWTQVREFIYEGQSRDMKKSDFCICKNKGANQLHGNRKADHAFVFATWIVQGLLFLNRNFKPLAIFCGSTAQFVWDLVGNPKDRFSQKEAQIFVSLCDAQWHSLHFILRNLQFRKNGNFD